MQAAGRPPLVVPSSHPSSSDLAGHGQAFRSFDPGVGVTASASQRERARWSVLIVTGSRCSAQPIRSAAHVVAWVRATDTEPGAADSGFPGKTLRNRAEPWISSSPRLFNCSELGRGFLYSCSAPGFMAPSSEPRFTAPKSEPQILALSSEPRYVA